MKRSRFSIAAGREIELSSLLFDLGYQWVVCARLGLASLLAILGGVEPDLHVQAGTRELAGQLRRMLPYEASTLNIALSADAYGLFVNQMVLSSVRHFRQDLAAILRWDDSHLSQAGWLELERIHGPRDASPVLRFYMPGDREVYAVGNYETGPRGAQTTFAINPHTLRLLGENVSMYYFGLGEYEAVRYEWRIWDLETGALVLAKSSRDITRSRSLWPDFVATHRPAEFEDASLVRAPDSVRMGEEMRCLNGPERVSRAQLKSSKPKHVQAEVVIRLRDRLAIVGRGSDGHIYRADVITSDTSDENTDGDRIDRVHLINRGAVGWSAGNTNWRCDAFTAEVDETPGSFGSESRADVQLESFSGASY